MSEEAFSVILWACSAYAAVTPAVGISNRCCPPSVPRSHTFSDFNYSPQFPFKSLIRLLLISPRCRSARVVSSCRCQSSLRGLGATNCTARGNTERLAGKSGGRILRWRSPCVSWRVHPVHRRARAPGALAHGQRRSWRPNSPRDGDRRMPRGCSGPG